MRRLIPGPVVEVDPVTEYADSPADFVRLNFVMSLDGSATDQEQWTDRLGGAADLRVFRTLRALSDGILVGARTVRTGRVGPHRPTTELREWRQARGKPAAAPVVVVTNSLRLDWSHRLFTAATSQTIVVTSARAAATRPAGHDSVHLVAAGDRQVDLVEAVRLLRADHGLRHLLCEGGPMLATSMINLGLVDEFCLSLAPTLIGSRHHTRLLGELTKGIDLTLVGAYEEESTLLLRYRL